MSSFTQIPFDFGPEEQAPPPVRTDREGAEEAVKPYMAASGVGVRIKSYKHNASAASATGDLFGPAAASPGPVEERNEAVTTGVRSAGSASGAGIEPSGNIESETGPSAENRGAVETGPSAELEAVAGRQPFAAIAEPAQEAEEPVAEETVPAIEARETVPAGRTAPMTEKARGRATARPATTGKRAANGATVKTASKRGRKSLKQVSAEADLIEVPEDEVLFSKQYYTMGEVSEMFRVNQSLLRFWEAEFDILQPRKNKKGDRYFRPVDIKNLHLIYHLLRQRKYTIEGAKEFLRKNKKAEERFAVIQRLEQIKAFLLEWKAQL